MAKYTVVALVSMTVDEEDFCPTLCLRDNIYEAAKAEIWSSSAEIEEIQHYEVAHGKV